MVEDLLSSNEEEEEHAPNQPPPPSLALAPILAPHLAPFSQGNKKIKIKVKVGATKKDKVPLEYKDDEEEQPQKEPEPAAKPLKRRYKEKSKRVVDKKEAFERLKKEIKAARPQWKRKPMRGSQPREQDNMETLFEQNKLHNQGENLAKEKRH